MHLLDLIPDTFLPVLNADVGDRNPRRLTLLYKSRGYLVSVLSRGLEDVIYDRPVQDAFLLKVSRRREVDVEYENQLTFAERPVGTRAYAVVTRLDENDQKHACNIPFYQATRFVSEIADEQLDHEIHEFFDGLNRQIVHGCETVAMRGLWLAWLRPDDKARALSRELADRHARLARIITGFFHEEPDHLPVPRGLLDPADRRNKDYFQIPRLWSPLILAGKVSLYGLLLMPAPFRMIDVLEKTLVDGFRKRFNRIADEKERDMLAFSEFAAAHPRFVPGLRRGYQDAKATVDIAAFGLQLVVAVLLVSAGVAYIALPFAGLTMLIGFVKISNAIRSGGRDFSGLLSTALNHLVVKKYALPAVRAH